METHIIKDDLYDRLVEEGIAIIGNVEGGYGTRSLYFDVEIEGEDELRSFRVSDHKFGKGSAHVNVTYDIRIVEEEELLIEAQSDLLDQVVAEIKQHI